MWHCVINRGASTQECLLGVLSRGNGATDMLWTPPGNCCTHCNSPPAGAGLTPVLLSLTSRASWDSVGSWSCLLKHALTALLPQSSALRFCVCMAAHLRAAKMQLLPHSQRLLPPVHKAQGTLAAEDSATMSFLPNLHRTESLVPISPAVLNLFCLQRRPPSASMRPAAAGDV